MKISVATSVFNLRKSRPFEYYLNTAIDFLEDMKECDIDIHVFTDQNKNCFPEANNIHIHCPNIDDLIEYCWKEKKWRELYSLNLADRPSDRFEEKDVPDLIGIWLGKFKMVHDVSKNCDCVLWQDSGIRMGVFEKNFSKYKKTKTKPYIYQKSLSYLAERNPITLLSSEKTIDSFHGVKMNKYKGSELGLCQAGLFLVNSCEAEKLKHMIAQYWNVLLDNGDYGTEENPLSMYRWDRCDFEVISYRQWLDFLGIGKVKIGML